MATGSGVFSRDALDAGSRILLEKLLPTLSSRPAPKSVCDLGCGWGAIGCFLAAHYPSTPVAMGDVNARAAWLAHYNACHNELANARVWCGDGLRAVRSECFEIVACNPPIRAGNAVIGVLFEDAYRCLQFGGEMWVVIRTAQGAKSWQKRLVQLFGNCETIALEKGYRVLKSVKGVGTRPAVSAYVG